VAALFENGTCAYIPPYAWETAETKPPFHISTGSSASLPDIPDPPACGSHARPSGPAKHAAADTRSAASPAPTPPTRAQWFIGVRRLIAVTRDRHRPQSARSRLAEGILRSHLPDGCLQCYQFQRFLPITDCKASLSKLRSTISFRSFVFASHYCFAPYAWLRTFPLHFAFPA